MSPTDLLPGAIGAETALAFAAGAGCFLTILALGRALLPGDPMAARARAHTRQRQQLRATLLAPTRRKSGAPVGLMRQLLERLKLTRGKESRDATARLAQAGLRSRDALVVFLGLRIVLPVILGAALWLVAFVAGVTTPVNQLICAAFGAVLGGAGPTLILGKLISRRKKRTMRALPDALDLMVICAEAGLSLDATLGRVGREIGPSCPELADEFGLTAIELGFLPNRRTALLNLIRRVDLPAMRGLVNTLVQTERYGTPLAHSLRVLASEFRDQRMLKAEEKAARLPATLTVPMILFILPTLFIVLIGPAAIQVSRTFLK